MNRLIIKNNANKRKVFGIGDKVNFLMNNGQEVEGRITSILDSSIIVLENKGTSFYLAALNRIKYFDFERVDSIYSC